MYSKKKKEEGEEETSNTNSSWKILVQLPNSLGKVSTFHRTEDDSNY